MMADAAALLSRAHGVNSIAPPVPARLRRASSAAGCSQRLAVKPSCCRAPRTTAERAAFPQRRSRGSALQAASLDASELASSSEPEKSDPELACPICFRPFVGRGGKSGCGPFPLRASLLGRRHPQHASAITPTRCAFAHHMRP